MTSIEEVDSEILNIRAQIANLQAHRANLSSILLSSPQVSTRLEQRPVAHERQRRNAVRMAKRQRDRNLENVYRACAGVTAYKVKDPDPNAVDDGNILGVQIDVSIAGEQIDTYHVLFNRPSSRHKTMLKIHHHTIPPCIPLKQLANKFLPQTRKDATTTPEQDLLKLGRYLRKELVSWHLRTAAVEKLRQKAGLPDKEARIEDEERKYPIGRVVNSFTSRGGRDSFESESESENDHDQRNGCVAVKITDIETDLGVSEMTITWSDGRVAMMWVAKNGDVERGIVKNNNGVRVAELHGKAAGRIETLLERLAVVSS